MIAALVSRELLFASRLREIASRTGMDLVRVDDPSQLPPSASVRIVLVDWAERADDWGDRLAAWAASAPGAPARVILFGPHTDLDAHAAARAAGLGPMWARSKLLHDLAALL